MKIVPLIVVYDRYGGMYSGGRYTAWNHWLDEVPTSIEDEDEVCAKFWRLGGSDGYRVGIGETVESAVKNLKIKI